MKGLYTIAKLLMEFLLEREIFGIVENIKEEGAPRKGKGGKYILKSTSYVEPLFDLRILPTASAFPMVCPPVDWKVSRHRRA